MAAPPRVRGAGLDLRLADLGINALPGFLGGIQLAGLLFFLNPDLPFGVAELARPALGLGALGALVTAAALTVVTWRRPGLARRILPWSISTVLALAALGDWLHASWLTYFIPPGINTRLVKAAIWLSVAALVGFYTALLHSFPPRRYGRRSLALFVILGLVSIYILVERREAFRPAVPPTPLPSTVRPDTSPRLLVVGLEGATLDAILPLAERGQLPFFAELMATGSHGRLASLSPTLADGLWTSLATGRYPYQHGILGRWAGRSALMPGDGELKLYPLGPFFPRRFTPGIRYRRLDAGHRRLLALWEILAELGTPTGVVGWPATHPATAPLAFSFSDRYFEGNYSAALPPELAERGVLFRVRPEELGPEASAGLGVDAPAAVARLLAADRWRESLTLFLLDQRPELGALFVRLPGLGETSRQFFGGFSAFEFQGLQSPAYAQASRLLTAYYRHLDQFLRSLWERQTGPRILAMVSPFGVEAPTGWRQVWKAVSRRSLEGSYHPTPDGVLFLRGEGIRAETFLSRAGLVDVAPTLLYGLRYPIARDLDGRALVPAFDGPFVARTPLTFVPSYETLAPSPPPDATP